MVYESKCYSIDNWCSTPQQVVNIPITLFESLKGKYFVGQSEALWVGNGSNAWAGLFNPCNSGTNLFANVITISNFSDEYLTAEIWLNARLSEKGIVSQKVSPSNTALEPLPDNKVNIRYVQSTEDTPRGGVNIYDRIVPPNGTLVSEEDGKFIVPPCGNYTIYIKSSSVKPSKVIVALGWWEEKLK
ncbi:DUF6143 family protein [Clostridium swellfunianum]|uniref:DUF6143 family protein n=1 Tax=Clostridium swellfunianum TaxID=1367462 RepID=UPI00202E55B5|nr:DUF6143 family protein [Clostridium swellfunianum]MCM0650724.1 DUF6143 family protein [Clostridium swellfunianum]